MLETIKPRDEAHWLEMRRQNITSTEVSALFGLSPYTTEFELFFRKRDQTVVDFETTDRMRWGTRLQDAIAAGIAEDQGWKIRRMDEYIRDNALKIGASFDFAILEDNQMSGLLEIKNVDSLVFRDGWEVDDDGEVQAPPHIEIQCQQQLMLSRQSACYIGALVGGNRVQLIKREPDVAVMTAIKEKVLAFWASVEANEPPEPDFIRDSEFITKLYSKAEAGMVLDASSNIEFTTLAQEHKMLGEKIKALDARRDGVKAQMLMQMKEASKVIGDGYSISSGIVKGGPVSYERSDYRLFKINWPKGKK